MSELLKERTEKDPVHSARSLLGWEDAKRAARSNPLRNECVPIARREISEFPEVGVLNSSYNLMASSSKRVSIPSEVGNLSSGEPVSFLKYTRAYNYDDIIVKDK